VQAAFLLPGGRERTFAPRPPERGA
jgi:hypothetical protein